MKQKSAGETPNPNCAACCAPFTCSVMARSLAVIFLLALATPLLLVRAQEGGEAPADAGAPAPEPTSLDRAHIVVQKSLSAPDTQNYLVQNKPFVVTYMVLNVGEGTAYNVSVRDEWPAETFSIVEGSASNSFAEIVSGGNHTFTLSLRASVSGTMTSARAAVEYKYSNPSYEPAVNLDGEDDGEEDAFIPVASSSTTPGRVDILTQETFDRIAAANNFNFVYITVAAASIVSAAPWLLHFFAAREAGKAL